jgi:cytochrome b subunit of formate dehydrogenase
LIQFVHFTFGSPVDFNWATVNFTGTVIDLIDCYHNFIARYFEINFSIKIENKDFTAN